MEKIFKQGEDPMHSPQSGKEFGMFKGRDRRHPRCGFDPWVRKIPGEGNSNPLQYSCLGNPMDRGTWQITVCGVAGIEKAKWEVTQNEVRKMTITESHKPVKAFGIYPKSNREPLKGFRWGIMGLDLLSPSKFQVNYIHLEYSSHPLNPRMPTHSSILAWWIPQTERTGGLQSIGSQRAGHNWSDLAQPQNFLEARTKCCLLVDTFRFCFFVLFFYYFTVVGKYIT